MKQSAKQPADGVEKAATSQSGKGLSLPAVPVLRQKSLTSHENQGQERSMPAVPALTTAIGGNAPVQRVLRKNGDGKPVKEFNLNRITYKEAVFILKQINENRVWSAEESDLVKINAVIAAGPGSDSEEEEAPATVEKKGAKGKKEAVPEKKSARRKGAPEGGKAEAERVITFPHNGKHCPPRKAVDDPAALVAATRGKNKEALYISNNPGIVVAWEAEARENGLEVDGFTIVYKFAVDIGADQGEMTKCIRIDGDHGHPISESTGKQSYDSYVAKAPGLAIASGNKARMAKVAAWLTANGLDVPDGLVEE